MGKVKGVQMVDLVKTLRANRQAAGAVLPERLHSYLDRRILPSSWYPEEDYQDLLSSLVEIVPTGNMDPWEFIGEFGARTQLGRYYRALIRKGEPAYGLQRFGAFWRMTHDTGRAECQLAGECRAQLRVYDFDFGNDGYARCVGGFLRGQLLLAGAKEAYYRLLGSGWNDGWEVTWAD